MRQDIKQEMLDYFKNKSDRTEQENRFLLFLQNEVEFFNITSVSRDDVNELNFDGANMTDAQMERLADKMENAYLANGYWDDLRLCAEYMEIPKLHDINDEHE